MAAKWNRKGWPKTEAIKKGIKHGVLFDFNSKDLLFQDLFISTYQIPALGVGGKGPA